MDVKIIDISKGRWCGREREREEGKGYDGMGCWSGRLYFATSIQWTRECIAHDPAEFSATQQQKTTIRVTARDKDYHFNLGSTSHLLHSRSDAERWDERRKQWNCSSHLHEEDKEGADGCGNWHLRGGEEYWILVSRGGAPQLYGNGELCELKEKRIELVTRLWSYGHSVVSLSAVQRIVMLIKVTTTAVQQPLPQQNQRPVRCVNTLPGFISSMMMNQPASHSVSSSRETGEECVIEWDPVQLDCSLAHLNSFSSYAQLCAAAAAKALSKLWYFWRVLRSALQSSFDNDLIFTVSGTTVKCASKYFT